MTKNELGSPAQNGENSAESARLDLAKFIARAAEGQGEQA
jgi:hypothetical protein